MIHTRFISLALGMLLALPSSGNTPEDPLKTVQKSILEDPLMEQVTRMATRPFRPASMPETDTEKYGSATSTPSYR